MKRTIYNLNLSAFSLQIKCLEKSTMKGTAWSKGILEYAFKIHLFLCFPWFKCGQGWAKYMQICIEIQIQNTSSKMYLITNLITFPKKHLSTRYKYNQMYLVSSKYFSKYIPQNLRQRLQGTCNGFLGISF